MRRLTRTIATPLALGGLLLLGACTADEAPTDDPTASQPADQETDAPADDDGDDVASGGGEGCLEGEWAADTTAMAERLLSNPTFAQMDPEVDVTGATTVTLADGVMTSVYDDNRVQLTMSLEGQEFVTETVMDGTTTGDYTVEGDVLTVTDVDITGAEITTTTTVNGEAIEVPDLGDAEAMGIDLGGESTFECSGDELRITPNVEGGENFTQVLTRK